MSDRRVADDTFVDGFDGPQSLRKLNGRVTPWFVHVPKDSGTELPKEEDHVEH